MKKHVPVLMTICMVVLLSGLGFWQLHRLQVKTLMLIGIEYKSTRHREALPTNIDDTGRFWDYRHVTVKGDFQHDHEFLLKPRTQDGKIGFDVVTPLKRADGTTVLVNRGFATPETLAKMDRPRGAVEIRGLGRMSRKGFFTPENNVLKNEWYWADTVAMAAAAGLGTTLPIVVNTDETIPEIPNNHRQYAIFWFSMAFAVIVIYVLYRRRERKA